MSWYNPFSWFRKKSVFIPSAKDEIGWESPTANTVVTPEIVKINNENVEKVNAKYSDRPLVREYIYAFAPPRPRVNQEYRANRQSTTYKRRQEDSVNDLALSAALGSALSTNTYVTEDTKKGDFSGGGATVEVDDTPSNSSDNRNTTDSYSSSSSDSSSSSSISE